MSYKLLWIPLLSACMLACAENQRTPTDTRNSESALTNAAMQEPLFTLVLVPDLTPEQNRLLSSIRSRTSSAEVYVGRLTSTPHLLLQIGKAVAFQVSPTSQLIAIGNRLVERGASNLSWEGILQNNAGSIDLVLTPKGVTASLRTPTTLYRIEPIGAGLHALIRVGNLPPEHPGAAPSGALQTSNEISSEFHSTQFVPSDNTQNGIAGVKAAQYSAMSQMTSINVLVVYTPSAATATGDINGLIQLAFDESNTSYSNSAINLTLASAYVDGVSYSEAGRTYSQHVAALQSTSDGIMDIVHSWRDQYVADVVVLILNDASACGQASQILATATTAFAVVHYDCATGNYSFAHEIGHLQGARHDRATDNTNTPYQYGHGYIEPGLSWRTIMAYPQPCNYCLRVQYWSNPNVTYPLTGQVMGTTAYEYDASVLEQTKGMVASFRGGPSLSLAGPTAVASGVTCQFDATPSGGTAPYTVTWDQVTTSPNQGFYPTSGTGTTFITHNYSQTSGSYYAYATVTDASGATSSASLSGPVTGYGGQYDYSRCHF